MADTYRRLEDDMKKTIGICLFAALLFVMSLFFGRWKVQTEKVPKETPLSVAETETEEKDKPEAAPSMQVQKTYRYVLREENGLLTVYEKDGKTILLETNIRVEHLSEETRRLLSEGIYVQDEKELYDLLESYSS